MNFDQYFDSAVGTGCGQNDASGQLHNTRLDCSVRWVQNYLARYTGAAFDLTPDLDPNTMLASDLYLVGSLSMRDFSNTKAVTAKMNEFISDKASSLVCNTQGCKAHFHCVLARVPVAATAFDLNSNLALRADIELLWELIGPLVGVKRNAPPSRTKPLARKRPGLIPILDEKGSIADRKAKGNANGTYWDSIISEMCQYQNQIQSGVAAMRQRGVPSEITELRVVDILVWMFRTKQRSACA
jgi:Family of unknown function (DUF6308)